MATRKSKKKSAPQKTQKTTKKVSVKKSSTKKKENLKEKEKNTKFYDQLKLNESYVSLALGVVVVVAISGLFFAFLFQSKEEVEEQRVLNSVITPTPIIEEEYVIQEDESLWDVAVKYYGDGFLFTEIVEANIEVIPNPDNVPPGTVIIIPNL